MEKAVFTFILTDYLVRSRPIFSLVPNKISVSLHHKLQIFVSSFACILLPYCRL